MLIIDIEQEMVVSKIKFAHLNKRCTLKEYNEQVTKGNYNYEKFVVEKIIVCENYKEWTDITDHFLNNNELYAKMGGAPRRHGVMVVFQNQKVYIDPQGYDYARYVGI